MNSDLKKKIIITVAVCLVLILPTVAAFIAYSSARNNPVTRKSVSGISVVTPDGGSFDFSRTGIRQSEHLENHLGVLFHHERVGKDRRCSPRAGK